jgi:hypothetical protein
MPECEICGEEVEKVYRCKVCGVNFCEFCGSIEKMLCSDCMDEEEFE